MPYSEMLIKPTREDLTNLGIRETRNPEAVDAAVSAATGAIMVVVNSVCGCAAGRVRPGVALALQNEVRPQDMIAVLDGARISKPPKALFEVGVRLEIMKSDFMLKVEWRRLSEFHNFKLQA